LQPAAPLALGAHSLTETVTNASGVTSAHSAPVSFTAIQAPVAGTPVAPQNIQISYVVAGLGPSTLINGMSISDTHPVVSGTGIAGDVIKLYDGTNLIGSTTVTADGYWTLRPATALAVGTHALSVTQANSIGASSPHSLVTTFTAAAPPVPGAPATPTDILIMYPVTSGSGYNSVLTDGMTVTTK
jgi:hypothetical protein